MKKMPERLKEEREDKGMSQQYLAKILGIGRSTLAGYETGNSTPPLDILIKYADIFDTTLDYLVGRTNNHDAKITEDDTLKISHNKNISITKDQFDLIKTILESHLKDK